MTKQDLIDMRAKLKSTMEHVTPLPSKFGDLTTVPMCPAVPVLHVYWYMGELLKEAECDLN